VHHESQATLAEQHLLLHLNFLKQLKDGLPLEL
jgi:hypothetical protein